MKYKFKLSLLFVVCLLLLSLALFYKGEKAGEVEGGVESPAAKSSALSTAGEVEKGSVSIEAPARFVLILNGEISWRRRLEMVRGLCQGPLAEGDTDWLFHILSRTPPADEARDWWVVMNEISIQLGKKPELSSRYVRELQELIRDEGAPSIARDYALQHLATWLAEASPAQAEQKVISIAATMAQAVRNPENMNSSVAATALNALADVARGNPSEEMSLLVKSLEPEIIKMATGESCSELPRQKRLPARISAIQAIGSFGLTENRPLLLDYISDEKQPTSVRISSIAMLGSVGTPDDIAILEGYSLGRTPLRFAAQEASKRLIQSLKAPL